MKSLGSIRRSFEPWNDPDQRPYIAFENITKKFGDFVAVKDLTLHIFQKEFFALLGGSGCGKSTLLRMLAGFENATEGQILLDGENMAGVPPYKRPVNMMFQSYALFPHMSVEKNIAFGLKQDGMAKSEIDDRVNNMLKLVKLDQFGKRKPHQLSGGQRQRVALARSIAKRPKVLLLDEPLGALDKKLREETQFELMDLQQDLGLTFLVVTHDQEEAMTMADRIAVMDVGRIVQIGTPVETYEAPNSEFVASFIGDINIFRGEVTASNAGVVDIETPDGMIIRSESMQAMKPGQKASFAIRPEKLRVSRTKPEGGINAASGEVWDIGYLGDMTVFHVKLKNGDVVKASLLNAVRTVEDPIGYDEEIWVCFNTDGGVVLGK
ncbi:spermidine/putrescine ABC transporter ATP-binding subunit [Hoeflea sp. IMCC20628]|uniref:ABC transporter ATP-binding protein n=1 Tax=Hoeflea sp. IMCC20628 TaxID=1620421 RepID=UPI00063A98FD|nr:ABC transporter ATP-binding protein [Hoeflea sp. IMCC20628]AKI02086.1 spermidine/putrescine ABC transporter ATP-binding subunit [Hoeflea sp. IMCC20628]